MGRPRIPYLVTRMLYCAGFVLCWHRAAAAPAVCTVARNTRPSGSCLLLLTADQHVPFEVTTLVMPAKDQFEFINYMT